MSPSVGSAKRRLGSGLLDNAPTFADWPSENGILCSSSYMRHLHTPRDEELEQPNSNTPELNVPKLQDTNSWRLNRPAHESVFDSVSAIKVSFQPTERVHSVSRERENRRLSGNTCHAGVPSSESDPPRRGNMLRRGRLKTRIHTTSDHREAAGQQGLTTFIGMLGTTDIYSSENPPSRIILVRHTSITPSAACSGPETRLFTVRRGERCESKS